MEEKIYAVVVYFDKQTEDRISQIINSVAERTGNRYMLENSIPPHVSLGIFGTDDEEAITEHFRSFAKTLSPADIVFDKTGSFGNVVLFLPPAENGFLRSANKSLHDMMPFSPAEGGNYLPGKWVPHCSICVLLDEETFPAAYETAERMFSPIKGRITRLVLAECYPYREKMIIDL